MKIINHRIINYVKLHPFRSIEIIFIVWATFFILHNTYLRSTSKSYIPDPIIAQEVYNMKYEKVVFAGGCFWCTESEFNHIPGVISAVSGYADVKESYLEGDGPSYQDVSSEKVTAREAVEVIYDKNKVSFGNLLEKYFRHINPTDNDGQFADRGYQYSPAIYYTNDTQRNSSLELIFKIDNLGKFDKKISVELLPFRNFYPAEEYHQDYKDKNQVRYEVYREGSGRNNYIRKNWEDDSSFVKEIFGDNNKIITNIQSTKEMKWKNFTTEIKEESLKNLTPIQHNVTQEDGTERPFSNEYDKNYEHGIYVDVVSGEPLFISNDKFDSKTGWPSFVKPINSSYVILKEDKGIFSNRIEVRSKIADSHLGHVFPDGPTDKGGMRYCMNSAALKFIPYANMEEEGYEDFIHMIK